MRRRVLAAAIILSAIFLLGGAYILGTIHFSTRSLDRLIVLHQVQILREGLLAEVQAVQSALKAKETRFFRGPEKLIANVRRMRAATRGCFGCHHAGLAEAKLVALRDYGARYEQAISRVLTLRANQERLRVEEDLASQIGDDLIAMLNEMIAITSANLEKRTRESVRRINHANAFLFAMVAVGPIGVIVLAFLFLRSFTQPLSALVETTRRLKAGDLSVRVPGLKREFRELGDSFNEMVEAVNNHAREMQRAEQMAVLGQLAAGMAHEIKNPLSAIKLTLHVLASELKLSEDDRDLFDKVEKEAGRIETLMRDLLSYARPRELHVEAVDVNELLGRAGLFGLQRLPSSGGRARIEIRKALDPSLPKVQADPDLLLQIFVNIVLNAVEAMAEGGELSIRSWGEPGHVNVEFCDQGPGVPEELREKIFEPFFTRKAKGTGLGLAVTKRLIEQHHGTIVLREAPGGGACFAIRLPAAQEGA